MKLLKTMLRISFATLLLALAVYVNAEDKKTTLKYVDALNFRMINKAFSDTETPFQRLPKYLKDSVRTDLWNRQQCSSGLGIRFATDSKCVGLRYTLLWDSRGEHRVVLQGCMHHQSDGDEQPYSD